MVILSDVSLPKCYKHAWFEIKKKPLESNGDDSMRPFTVLFILSTNGTYLYYAGHTYNLSIMLISQIFYNVTALQLVYSF